MADETVELSRFILTRDSHFGGRLQARGFFTQIDTRAPTVTDDVDSGFGRGSVWYDCRAAPDLGVYLCLDPAVGAAVWLQVGSGTSGTDELVGVSADDTTPGFLFTKLTSGTTALTKTEVSPGGDERLRLDVANLIGDTGLGGTAGLVPPPAPGQATWVLRGDGVWVNPNLLFDPATHASSHVKDGSDEVNGDHLDIDFTPQHYIPDTLPAEASDVDHLAAHLAGIDNALAAGDGGASPGELLLGTLLDYPFSGGVTVGEVQYVRLFLGAGTEIENMRCFLDSGGTAARNFRAGIYDQTDPEDETLEPDTRVAQTAVTDTDFVNGTFITAPLLANYTVTVTGFYWFAFVSDSSAPKFAATPVCRAGFLPVRREAGAGTTLPASTGVLTNPASAVIYCSGVIP